MSPRAVSATFDTTSKKNIIDPIKITLIESIAKTNVFASVFKNFKIIGAK